MRDSRNCESTKRTDLAKSVVSGKTPPSQELLSEKEERRVWDLQGEEERRAGGTAHAGAPPKEDAVVHASPWWRGRDRDWRTKRRASRNSGWRVRTVTSPPPPSLTVRYWGLRPPASTRLPIGFKKFSSWKIGWKPRKTSLVPLGNSYKPISLNKQLLIWENGSLIRRTHRSPRQPAHLSTNGLLKNHL